MKVGLASLKMKLMRLMDELTGASAKKKRRTLHNYLILRIRRNNTKIILLIHTIIID